MYKYKDKLLELAELVSKHCNDYSMYLELKDVYEEAEKVQKLQEYFRVEGVKARRENNYEASYAYDEIVDKLRFKIWEE